MTSRWLPDHARLQLGLIMEFQSYSLYSHKLIVENTSLDALISKHAYVY
jgi:ABC-type polar amino acid transport system ATPase subunit